MFANVRLDSFVSVPNAFDELVGEKYFGELEDLMHLLATLKVYTLLGV